MTAAACLETLATCCLDRYKPNKLLKLAYSNTQVMEGACVYPACSQTLAAVDMAKSWSEWRSASFTAHRSIDAREAPGCIVTNLHERTGGPFTPSLRSSNVDHKKCRGRAMVRLGNYV
jgi:hypothetical protein